MPSVSMPFAVDRMPTTDDEIHVFIMEASKTLPKAWLDADLAVWEDPLFWMLHRCGEIYKDTIPREEQARLTEQATAMGKVAFLVTLTDDPEMSYVVGRLKIT